MSGGKKVLIIGAGLGGLCTALRLGSKGYDVTILEKYHQPGGRLNQLTSEGFTFDMGPSFFSMSYEFDELFRSIGISNPVPATPLDPLYSVYFSNRKLPYIIYRDLKKLAGEFKDEQDFETKAANYLRRAGELFHDSENIVIRSNFKSVAHYLSRLATVPWKHTGMLIRTMWQELEKTFDTEEVKIVFSLVAFFLGATPFNTPAVYGLLSYTELVHDGYWNVEGGMYRITEILMQLLKERGVKVHYNTEVIGYNEENNTLQGFTDAKGNSWQADIYVVSRCRRLPRAGHEA